MVASSPRMDNQRQKLRLEREREKKKKPPLLLGSQGRGNWHTRVPEDNCQRGIRRCENGGY